MFISLLYFFSLFEQFTATIIATDWSVVEIISKVYIYFVCMNVWYKSELRMPTKTEIMRNILWNVPLQFHFFSLNRFHGLFCFIRINPWLFVIYAQQINSYNSYIECVLAVRCINFHRVYGLERPQFGYFYARNLRQTKGFVRKMVYGAHVQHVKIICREMKIHKMLLLLLMMMLLRVV